MIDRLLRLLQGGRATVAAAEEPHLSVAVLLVEAGLMHGDFSAEERATTTRLIERRFGLSVDEADELITRAEARARSTAQYFPFTNSLNNSMSLDDKIAVVEMLWRIAYADGHLDAFEDQLIRQVAGLLHVPGRERMQARRRVLET